LLLGVTGLARSAGAEPAAAEPTKPPQAKATAASAAGPTKGLATGPSAATCERYVAVLSGKSTDAALLSKPEVQALAVEVPDLPTCGAVRADSDALCKLLPGGGGKDKKSDPRQSCRKSWAQFHELRKNTGRPFVTEVELEECRASKDMKSQCDAIAEAFRSGDPAKCPPGSFHSNCQAAVTLDASYCTAEGDKAEERIKRCKQHIEEDRLRTKGLKAIAESGDPLDRQFAQAALGQPDACADMVATAMAVCTSGNPHPAPTAAADDTH
jgi:hypothetical protein